MKTRRFLRRRRPVERGFSLVEALVALTIAALTLSLLAGAAFSLRALSERGDAHEARTGAPLDMLATRRVLRRWASETMLRGAGGTASFTGGPREMRLLLTPDLPSGTPPRLAILRIEQRHGADVLSAYRAPGAGSVLQHVAEQPAERSELIRSTEPLRFAYRVEDPDGGGTLWVAERPAGPPPRAFALQIAGAPALTAPFPKEMDAGCLAALGIGQMQMSQCRRR